MLAGVDLDVARGEVVTLAGPSGVGQDHAAQHPRRLGAGGRGHGRVAGRCPPPEDAPWRASPSLPQTLGLLDELTIGENIALPLRLDRGAGDDCDDPDRLMARLGLDRLGGRFPSEVSLGEQQRAALARAAVVRPAVLLADEPIAHQNVAWAEEMMAALRELAEAGTACLLAAHDEVAFTAADRVVELHDGVLRPWRART